MRPCLWLGCLLCMDNRVKEKWARYRKLSVREQAWPPSCSSLQHPSSSPSLCRTWIMTRANQAGKSKPPSILVINLATSALKAWMKRQPRLLLFFFPRQVPHTNIFYLFIYFFPFCCRSLCPPPHHTASLLLISIWAIATVKCFAVTHRCSRVISHVCVHVCVCVTGNVKRYAIHSACQSPVLISAHVCVNLWLWKKCINHHSSSGAETQLWFQGASRSCVHHVSNEEEPSSFICFQIQISQSHSAASF